FVFVQLRIAQHSGDGERISVDSNGIWKLPKSMSNILNDLGIDEDDLDWFHLAICRGMDTNLFYEKYESDANVTI
ncbi:MAG UNVERIFIED_CONTAM: hypothetical protein LVQ98_09255, partial [Rickettsiaceae bacterium]